MWTISAAMLCSCSVDNSMKLAIYDSLSLKKQATNQPKATSITAWRKIQNEPSHLLNVLLYDQQEAETGED